jgi:hypothetical protein
MFVPAGYFESLLNVPESQMFMFTLVECLGKVVDISLFSCCDESLPSYHKFEKGLRVFLF